MNLTIAGYGSYLVLSLALTMWVARTLFRHGRRFLVDAFRGDQELADSVNRLLVVGFYLVNIGYVTLALKLDQAPISVATLIEALSAKVGLVALVLGAMHYGNMAVFARIRVQRRRPVRPRPAPVRPAYASPPPPVAPASGASPA
jgi:hypothetical protein